MGDLQQRNFGSVTYGIPDGWFYTETVAKILLAKIKKDITYIKRDMTEIKKIINKNK